MRCKNGLHGIDPDDVWRASNGARCRECYLETQDRYNASEKGRERWSRYEGGWVGMKHRFADEMRRNVAAIRRIEEVLGAEPCEVRKYVPDYNDARKTEAMYARVRALGWGYKRGTRIEPLRDDAAPRRVIEEVMALWRLTPSDNFKRRKPQPRQSKEVIGVS